MTTTRAADGALERTSVGTDWLAFGAALVTVTLWASAFVGIRAVSGELSPGSLAFGRLLVGSIALGAVALGRRQTMPHGRDLALVVGCGIVWLAAYNVILNAAERIVDAGTASMLVNVGPILIAVFGGLFLGEGFPPRLVAGCAIAFGGAVVIGLATTSGTSGPNAVWGILLCLLAALAYASGVTLQKPVLARISAINVTWLACCVGLVVTAPFAPLLVSELGRAHVATAAWVVYLGLFPTSIAFTTWGFALGRTTAGRMGATTYLVPPIAIGLGWVLLGEAPPALAILGGGACIAGVVVARNRDHSRSPSGGRRRVGKAISAPAPRAGSSPTSRFRTDMTRSDEFRADFLSNECNQARRRGLADAPLTRDS